MSIPLCKHYSSAAQGWLICSEGHPWNGWKLEYDERGALVYSSFVTGLRWDYLSHLKESPACREQAGLSLEEVERLLQLIEEEWKATVQY